MCTWVARSVLTLQLKSHRRARRYGLCRRQIRFNPTSSPVSAVPPRFLPSLLHLPMLSQLPNSATGNARAASPLRRTSMTTPLEENSPYSHASARTEEPSTSATRSRHIPALHPKVGAMFGPSSSAIALSLEEAGRSRGVEETALGVNRNERMLCRIASPRLALHRTSHRRISQTDSCPSLDGNRHVFGRGQPQHNAQHRAQRASSRARPTCTSRVYCQPSLVRSTGSACHCKSGRPLHILCAYWY